MKTKFFLAASVCAAMCMSCKDDFETVTSDSASELRISATMASDSRAGFTPKNDWQTGDAMGLFVYKATGWGEIYDKSPKVNNKSTKQASGAWQQEIPTYLTSTKAYVYAYYPYSTGVTDGTRIPVSIAPSTGTASDYLWGKSSNQVSVIETDAKIPMNHALSQFTIRLKVSPEYRNDGNLTSAKLKSSQAKFATTGTMNINDNGRITYTPTSTELSWTPNTTVPAQGSPSVDFNAAIFPMNVAKNEVTLEVVIDGATYKYSIPQINWKAGKRYAYAITMQSNDAVIGGESGLGITIEPWEDNPEQGVDLIPVK